MPQTLPQPRMLRGDEADLFNDHHSALEAAVRHLVADIDDAIVQDACSFAWLQLMRTQPERGDALFAWLRTVAVREAWKLAKRERRAGHFELVPHWHERLSDDTLQQTIDAHQALGALADLPPRQRVCVQLVVAGHSYADVVRITGRSSSHVNKQLVRARRRLRQQRLADGD